MKAETIVKAVKAYLKKEELKFDDIGSKKAFMLSFPSKRSRFDCIREFLVISENGIHSSTTCPIKADEDAHDEVVKYINKLNWMLRSGNFEMDPGDGEVRFRLYTDLEGLGDNSHIDGLIENTVYLPVNMLDRFGNDLFRVMTGQADADELHSTDEVTRTEIRQQISELRRKLSELDLDLDDGESEKKGSHHRQIGRKVPHLPDLDDILRDLEDDDSDENEDDDEVDEAEDTEGEEE